MNVSSAALPTSYTPSLTPASPGADTATAEATPSIPSGSPSSATSSGGGSCPALDAQKQLSAISKEMVAIMLISDPVQRAKAAASIFKQFASVAKQYAAATADGRAAAKVQSEKNQQANAALLSGQSPVTDGTASTDGTAQPDNSQTDPALQASPSAASAAPTFVPDQIMEEIKSFANSAMMVYQAAAQQVQQKHGDKSGHATKADMDDAKKMLDQAATDVEGAPDASAAGYTAGGGASAAAPASLLSLSA